MVSNVEFEVLERRETIAQYTCSYDEEKVAMNHALEWMLENSDRQTLSPVLTLNHLLHVQKADRLM